MDLWQLNIFCKVVELKSFSKAGDAVHLSQPTVSSHIKDLEDHFGCRLVDRLSKEAVPTGAGKLLYDYARRMIALREETETALAEFQGKIRGRLTLGGSTIPGTYILPRMIGGFTLAHPEVQVTLINGDTEKIIEEVLDGRVEIGVVGAQSTDANIVQEPLVDDEMRLVVPQGHRWAGRSRVDVPELLKEPFILREAGSGTLQSIQLSLGRLGHSVDDLKGTARMSSTQSVIEGIKAGVGVSIVSSIAVAEAVSRGALAALHVEGLNLKRRFYLTRHRHRSASPICIAFIEFLTDRCRRDGAPS